MYDVLLAHPAERDLKRLPADWTTHHPTSK